MNLINEFEQLIDKRLNERLSEMTVQQVDIRPWLSTEQVAEELSKTVRWVRETFTEQYLIDKGLVKKVSGEWLFLHPEFLQFVHTEWFKNQ
ncbi:hypothetical protein ACYSNR_02105 [Enterococcus sp. LJL128]